MTAPLITEPGAPRPPVPTRLVALDLDGTCLDADQRLHPRIRDAVRAVATRLPVVVATGRMYPSTAAWACEMHVTAPLVCYQGAVVRDLPSVDGQRGALLYEEGLGAGPALRALGCARENDWHFQAYHDDVLFCERDRPEAHLYARIAQCEITFVDDLVDIVSQGTVKAVVVIDDAQEVTRCQQILTDELGEDARVFRSLPPFIEVTNPTASKGRAVSRICERMGLDMREVVAIGDAPNDIDLLASVGFGIAVQGSRSEVLAVADVTCPGPTAGGVADALSALGLLQGR